MTDPNAYVNPVYVATLLLLAVVFGVALVMAWRGRP